MTQIDVSVVIPCYNSQAYIEECLVSILDQTGVTVEILVIDDLSTDGSAAIIKTLAQKHANIRVFTNAENMGQARSRNTGIEHATGRYVALLDSDDYYVDATVLQRWVARADHLDSDLCIAQYLDRTREDVFILSDKVVAPSDLVSDVSAYPAFANVRQSWEILFKRTFLNQHQIRFSKLLRQREDRLFFTEALLYAKRICAVDFVAMVYRRHDASTMQRVTVEQMRLHTTSMVLQRQVIARARQDGYPVEVVEKITSISNWLRSLSYWSRLLIEGMPEQDFGKEAVSDALTPKTAAAEYLQELHKLTENAGKLSDYPDFFVQGKFEKNLKEGVLDLARICLELKRFDLLLAILRDRKIHYAEVYKMAGQSRFPWAGDAATHYLRFNRDHLFEAPGDLPDPAEVFAGIKRFIIHVGQPKTGTSAIQERLESDRIALIQQGVLYPIIGGGREHGVRRNRSAGHARLVENVLNGNGDRLGHLAAEIQNQTVAIKTVILSAENIVSQRWLEDEPFSLTNPLARFLARAGFENVEIVGVFRDPKSWTESYFKELSANPFNDFFSSPAAFRDSLMQQGLLDYAAIKSALADLPNVTAMHFADYADLAEAGAEHWFYKTCGIRDVLSAGPKAKTVNASFSDAQALQLLLSKAFHLTWADRNRLLEKTAQSEVLRADSFRFFNKAAKFQRNDDASNNEWFSMLLEQAKWQAVAPMLDYSAFQAIVKNEAHTEALENINQRLQETEGELEYMRSSKSWKITRPLRSALTLYRRIFSNAR